jgi:hypothetical protein
MKPCRVTAVVRESKNKGDTKDSARCGVTVANTPENLEETLGDELANYQARTEAPIAEVTEALKEEAARTKKAADSRQDRSC